MPTLAIAIFVAAFAIATFRNIHLGVLMIPAACAVGVWLAGMSLREVVAGFPVNIMVLVAGVTYFFGIAQGNGTIDRIVQKLLTAVGARRGLLPFVFFLITAGIAAMGSSQAGYVMIPLAMAAARRSGVDSMVMAVAINSGMSTGGFAPTSLFGIVTIATARQAGIDLNPLTLLGAALVANLALIVAARWLFPGPSVATAPREPAIGAAPAAASVRFASHQIVTLTCICGLILFVITGFSLGFEPDIGVTAFGFGAALALLYPVAGAEGIRRIDWSTAFMVGGIVTFVGVLQRMDAVNLLGHAAMNVGTPLVAAFVICMIAGLVSAFASTTGILAALVPMAVPLATSGGVAGWALLSAMGVCASIVDASPFSTTGALLVASAAEDERPRLKSLLTRWGLSMVIVGPVVAVLVLLLLGSS
ncbi:MAG: C4-dicarboxylate ABC transporter [Acidobacteria bacterium]|nr:MAG: C4-dicarboxylate ABC transporter [Acidobacteriota bacterium]